MNKHVRRALIAILGLCGGIPAVQASDLRAACQQLENIGLAGVTFNTIKWQRAGRAAKDPSTAFTGASAQDQSLPAYCLVQGEIDAYQGVGNKPYGTRFELRLPANGNHSLLFQGGGGVDGFVAPALGSIPAHNSTAKPALERGYAVVSMNGGHPKPTAEFGEDQQARINFAYAAIGKVTLVAKSLTRQFYQQNIKHTVFMGCSNGGREAMMAAQRYPNEFDGIIAGDPGFRLAKAAIGEAWDSQQLMSIAPKNTEGERVLARALTQSDMDVLSEAVLKKCDILDGIKDGFINNYQACHFSPEAVACGAGEKEHCLTSDKVKVVNAIFKGAHNSAGEALYSSWPYDAGINAKNWREWKLGTAQKGKPNALNLLLGAGSLVNYFMTPPQPEMSALDFDFDSDPQKIVETAEINDADATFLSSFIHHGGKMIIFQGMADPVFSADDIISWYQQVVNNSAAGDVARTQQFARLFMIPGMTHCGGGPALDDIDPLSALENWLDKGKAPAQLAAHGAGKLAGRSQPLCPYPAHAHYVKGDPKKISSYQCITNK